MARPKPAEEIEGLTIRPPARIAKKIRDLAKESKMSVNAYVVHVLTDAAERGVIVREVKQVVLESADARRDEPRDP